MAFRPFFLGAAAFAIVSVAIWLHTLQTGRQPDGGYLPLTLWHAHEMLFGFALAVVAGFLLTAARTWTGRDTLHGYPLLALWLVWLAGRVAFATGPWAPGWLHAALGIAFPAVVTVALARPIITARSRRNLGIVVVLSLFTVAATLIHLEASGLVEGVTMPAMYATLHGIVLLNVVVGGRIIPLFTRNRTGAEAFKVPAVDRAAIASAALVAVLGSWAVATNERGVHLALAGAALASAALQTLRMRTWGTRAALRVPLLAVLHAGYAWIAAGHLLLGLSMLLPSMPKSGVVHALTIGVIGTMTVGMMTRVSLGHTGRPIADTRLATTTFVAINLAALGRLLGLMLPPTLVAHSWHISGALFAFAYLGYLVGAVRILLSPRPDGKPG